MTFAAFLETAWKDHGDRPQEVADRLAGSLPLIVAGDQIAPFARIVTHVFGEHLGEWQRGSALLESLRDLPVYDGSAAGAVANSVAALRYAGGDRSALATLPLEGQVSALATAASAFAGRAEFTQAVAAYSDALERARAGMPMGTPAFRALAVGGNNLAAALEQKQNRDEVETEGMIAAAEAGLKYWRLAGTWLEEERAEYRLTRSRLQAGKPQAAIESALRCIDVCGRNGAPPFEQFFGYAVLALAQRAAGDDSAFEASRTRALLLYDEVPGDDRQWCAPELRELGE